MLRFYQNLGFREMGQRLGKTEEAARKQTNRALEKLSGLLARRGAVVPATTLATGLTSAASTAAPAALAQAISQSAVAGASLLTTATILTHTIQAMSTGKVVGSTAGLCLALGLIPTVTQWHTNQELKWQVASLQQALQIRNQSGSTGAAASSPRIATGTTVGSLALPSVDDLLGRAKARNSSCRRTVMINRTVRPPRANVGSTKIVPVMRH